MPLPTDAGRKVEAEMSRIRTSKGKTRPDLLRKEMQRVMMDDVGIFREDKNIRKAVDIIHELQHKFATDLTIDDHGMRFNTDLLETFELGCLLDIAEVSAVSALHRTESRGAHSREDFPKRDDVNWLKHTFARRSAAGQIDLSYKPVVIKQFQPKERVY